MIADIEFRWVRRDGKRSVPDPANPLRGDIIVKRKKVLQFRKQFVLNTGLGWTDWQDVPAVEE